MADNPETSPITPAQAEIFARGLYFLADIDGIDDREVQLIRAFLEEVELPKLLRDLPGGAFDATAAGELLGTSYLKRVFLRTAIVLVRADGVLSELELAAIRDVADAFGEGEELDALLDETEGVMIV